MDKKLFRSLIYLILFTAGLILAIINFNVLWNILGFIVSVAMPFILGLCMAFIINKPYVFFAEKAYSGLSKKNLTLRKLRKPLALITAYIIVFGIIVFLFWILIPQLVESVQRLVQNFSNYVEGFQGILSDIQKNELVIYFLGENNNLFDTVNEFFKVFTGDQFAETIKNITTTVAPSLFNFMSSVTTNVFNAIMGIIVSFYFLACKDRLLYQTRKFLCAYVPKKFLPKIFEVGNLTNKMFGRYIYGRVLDSAIIGIICFICMSIFNWNYALLISVIVGITNIIPVFGPFLGAIPSIFILLLIDPFQALWFTVFIIALQQIDGNIIGPRVVGSSIGISGFWIMVSVIIGGGLFGVVGMFIAVPIFAIVYALIGENVNKRIQNSEFAQELGNEPDTDILKHDKQKEPYNVKDSKIVKELSGRLRKKKK